MPVEVTRFRIVINNYYFGWVKHTTFVTQDSLETTHDDLNGKKTRDVRLLQSEETAKMKKFLSAFPLTNLKEKYINEKIKDGFQIGFDISVNDMHKRIYVSNEYQNDLGELVNVIRPMLKEDYIGYRKEYFRQKN